MALEMCSKGFGGYPKRERGHRDLEADASTSGRLCFEPPSMSAFDPLADIQLRSWAGSRVGCVAIDCGICEQPHGILFCMIRRRGARVK